VKEMNLLIKKRKEGFTLIELLVVVAIIAILALIVLLALNPVEMARRSRDSRRMSDIGTIRKAIDLALADGEGLNSTGGWQPLSPAISVNSFFGANISKYLSVVPADPFRGTSTQILSGPPPAPGEECQVNTSGVPVYQFWSNGDTYILRANMESQENCNTVVSDGNNNGTYEIGTQAGLEPPAALP
jgi:prepilin-type N-terminal cleavage/methylation domain-containing protein